MSSNDWKKHYLGDLCTKITDGTHKTPKYKDSGVVFLSAANIKDGQLSFDKHKYISLEEHEFLTKRTKPEVGDVMLSKSGSLGDAVVIPELGFEFSIFESLALIKLIKEKVTPLFLKQYFCSPLAKKYFWSITSGIAVKHLHLGDLRKMKIPLPPLPDQKAIADVLSIWDRAISTTERLILAKEKRFDWLTSKLICNPDFDRGHVRDFTSEISARNKGEKIQQVLSVTNHSGFVLPEDQFARSVASANLSNYKIVTKGEYAYNPSRINVGSIARLDDWSEGVLSPMYVVFSIDEQKVDSDFFLHWLNSHEAKQRIKRSAQGSVRETVSFPDLGSIPFPMPGKTQQTEIAETLNTAQREIDLLKKLAEKYKAQKRGLMQKLLTGEWR